jgi:hypothetical protein
MATDHTLLRRYLQAGAVADDEVIQRSDRAMRRIDAELQTVERRLRRLLDVFEAEDHIPDSLRQRCLTLEEERSRLRAEMLRHQAVLDRLDRTSTDPEQVAGLLGDLVATIPALPLAAQKQVVQSWVSQITVYHHDLEPRSSDTLGDPAGGPVIRTRDLMVNIQMRQSPAGAEATAGLVSNVNHRTRESSGNCDFGSGPSVIPRIRWSVLFPLSLPRTSGVRAAVHPPAARRRRSALERALQLQAMLHSGQVKSRAALARHLGVTRAAITKALKPLEAAPPP